MTIDSSLSKAKHFRDLGKDLNSSIKWAKVVFSSTKSKEDKFRLCQLLLNNKEYKRCLYLLENEDGIKMRILRGKCLWGLGMSEEALAEIVGVDGDSELMGSVELLKGEIQLKRNNFKEAKECFRRAISYDLSLVSAFDLLMSISSVQEEFELFQMIKNRQEPEKQFYLADGLCLGNLKIQRLFESGKYQETLQETSNLLEIDLFDFSVLILHICCLYELNRVQELFRLSHQLVENYPTNAIAWFSVGCFYLVSKNPSCAKKAFTQSTTLDSSFYPSWIGYGHSFSMEGEHDSSISAYCTANRLQEGSSKIYLAMEYSTIGQYELAKDLLQHSFSKHFNSSHCINTSVEVSAKNELGVVLYQLGSYGEAIKLFKECLRIAGEEEQEIILINLGKSFLKDGNTLEAQKCFEKSCDMKRNFNSVLSLAYLYHIQKRIADAIELYHEALSFKKDDFCQLMLEKALLEFCTKDSMF